MKTVIAIIKSIYNLMALRLHFPKKYLEKNVCMKDGTKFLIFRHMNLKKNQQSKIGSILIIRFKFKRFGHKINIIMSKIPILAIAGFPGFRDKLWMIDWKKGYWQGIYQMDDVDAIEEYEKSFVLKMMNKRSIGETISYRIIPGKNINDYLQSILFNVTQDIL